VRLRAVAALAQTRV